VDIEQNKIRSTGEQTEIEKKAELKGIYRFELKTRVSWDQAKELCEKQGYKLPTKKQLEDSGISAAMYQWYTFAVTDDGKPE